MNCGTIGTISSSYTQAVWSGSNRITINRPASDLTDFTFLFTGTYEFLRTTANGGLVTNASGFDIAFYSDGPLSSLMKFERAYWNGTTGECEFWIKIPTLSSSFNTVIYIAYGNSAITTDQSDVANTYDANTTAVFHFSDGTTLSASDALGVNNGTIVNDVTAVAGKIDGGASFGGSGDYINIGNNSSIETQIFTWSGWVYPTGSGNRYIFGDTVTVTPELGLQSDNSMVFNSKGSATLHNTGANAILNDAWSYVAIWTDGTNYGLFYNGAYNSTIRTVTFSYTGDILIGTSDASNFPWQGYMDNVKFSNVARSEVWLDTEYANQNSPSTFYTIT